MMASRTQRPRRDSDSDEYDLNDRNRNQRKPIKYRNESSDESDHQEKDSNHSKGGNFADPAPYMRDQRESQSPAQNVRVVARSRPNPVSRPNTSSAPSGGFIPRATGNSAEWRPKSIRVEDNSSRNSFDRNYESSSQQNLRAYEDDRSNNAWARGSRDSARGSADFEEVDDTEYLPRNRKQPPTTWNGTKQIPESGARSGQPINNQRRRMEEEYHDEEEPRSRNAPARRPPSSRYSQDSRRDERERQYAEDVDDVQEDIEVLELSDNYGRKKVPQSRNRPAFASNKPYNNNNDDNESYSSQQNANLPNSRSYPKLSNNSNSNDGYINNQRSSNYRANNNNHRDDNRYYEEEREEERPKNKVTKERSITASTDTGNSFSSFVRSQAAAGIMLPRKSGRYGDGPIEDDDDAEEEDREDDNRVSTGQENADTDEDDDIEEIPLDAQGNQQKRRKKKGGNKQLVHKGNWTENPQRGSNSNNVFSNNNGMSGGVYDYSGLHSFVLVAHPQGTRTPMVQCTIIRDRNSIHGKLYPTYELIMEEPRKSLIIAQKMGLNRTSNYHLFDMTRGQAGHTLSKKSGNYLGKLRSKNTARLGYTLLSAKSDREEVGSVLFEKVTLLDQIQDGNQPRRMKILLPRIDASNVPVSVSAATYGVESLMDVIQAIDDNKRQVPGDFVLLQTKDPVFENGNYRLNFHGRVSLPSVKNFQIVTCDDINDVKCQFGKVDKDVFHLDFKSPFTAFEAFAIALCQFNL